MKSQYLEPYKSHVISSLKAGVKPYSVGTFLVHHLHGEAKNWQGRYLGALKRGLEKDNWIECASKRNGLAYKPIGE